MTRTSRHASRRLLLGQLLIVEALTLLKTLLMNVEAAGHDERNDDVTPLLLGSFSIFDQDDLSGAEDLIEKN
jgi:hypothetical protein